MLTRKGSPAASSRSQPTSSQGVRTSGGVLTVTSKACLDWWSLSQGSLDRHCIPGLLLMSGCTSSAFHEPGHWLPCLPTWVFLLLPLHTHAPSHWLWLTLQTPCAPGCLPVLAPSLPLHTHTPGSQLQLTCAPHPWTPEGCILLAEHIWTISGLGKPVNFSTIQWAVTIFSPVRSESEPKKKLERIPALDYHIKFYFIATILSQFNNSLYLLNFARLSLLVEPKLMTDLARRVSGSRRQTPKDGIWGSVWLSA